MKTLDEALNELIYNLNKNQQGDGRGTGYGVGDGSVAVGEKFKAELLDTVKLYRPSIAEFEDLRAMIGHWFERTLG